QGLPPIAPPCFVSSPQPLYLFGGDAYEFGCNDSALDDPGYHSLEAIEVTTEIREMDPRHRNFVLLENGANQQIGQRARRRHRDRLAFQILDLVDGRSHHQSVRHAGPIASENLDVCTVGASEDSRAWTRLNAVELAREHRLVRSGAVLQWHDLDLEAMPRSEITLTYHQHEPGIAFWLDYAVLPRLEVLPEGRRSPDCRHQ